MRVEVVGREARRVLVLLCFAFLTLANFVCENCAQRFYVHKLVRMERLQLLLREFLLVQNDQNIAS